MQTNTRLDVMDVVSPDPRLPVQVVGGSGGRVSGTKGALHVWQPTMAVLGGFLVLFLWQCSRRKRLLLLRRRGGDTTRRRLAL